MGLRRQLAVRSAVFLCGMGLLALGVAASGFSASRRTHSTEAAVAKSPKLHPSWMTVTRQLRAGSVGRAVLDPTVASRSCTVSVKGPYEGQAESWHFLTSGGRVNVTLRTRADATPGHWRLRASCLGRDGNSGATSVILAVQGASSGHGLLLRRTGLRIVSPRPHAQAGTRSSRTPVARVKVDFGGRGGGSDPGDDYPAKWKNIPQDSVFDDWREYNRECTSFVAWALASRQGFGMPFFANAIDWGAKARARGYRVDGNPAVGSVAWSTTASSWGHVAYVQQVIGTSVRVEEYNYYHRGAYDSRTVPASSFTGYIHFHDQALPPPPPPPPTTTAPPPPPPTTTAPPTTTTTTSSSDKTPPSTPGSLSVSNVTASSLRLNWAASSDNVGVSGYDAFLNGNKVGSVSVLYGDFIGLACNTTYTLGVAARDAAGNVSATASVQAKTGGCPPPPPSPSVSVSKGAAHTTSTCTASVCAYVVVTFSNFGAGNHTVGCYADDPYPYDTTHPFYSYTTSSTSSAVCVYGYPGYHVWAKVDGVESNHYTW